MSQPPQGSPGEQGGFGAPYEPQPGVYGDPAQHGPPPPGPYGYPQPPTQPAPLPSGGPGGPGRPSRGRAAGIVAAVLAGVLVVGAGVWFVVGGGDDADDRKPVAKGTESGAPKQSDTPPSRKATPDPGAAELNKGRKEGEAPVRWIQKNGVDLPEGGDSALGPWVVGDTVAKAMYRTASAYSLADGAQEWSLRLPSDVCAAPTRPTADGKIVIGLMSDTTEEAFCNRLQMIDLATGKAGWTASYDRSETQDALSDVVMAVNGDVVTVGRTSLTDAYRISDGKHLWGKLSGGSCQPYGLTSGAVPLAAVDCRKEPIDPAEEEIRRIDPATGRTVWTYKVKKGWKVDQFYSVDPPVVSVRKAGAESEWAVVLLDSDGTYRAQPQAGNEDYGVRCADDLRNEGGNLDHCIGAAADASTFYLATKAPEDSDDKTNAVVAFDRTTGKRKWKVDAPAGQTLLPLRVEGGKVLMYLSPPAAGVKGAGGGIMALGPQGGPLQPVLRHPASAAAAERTFYDPLVHYADGRSLLMHGYVTGPSDKEEMELKTMIAFGD
ncbi:PQQ-binding-like beta-propeller repeat protein [Streptomyces sp. C11-1]|uniref:PQQ-binding-like beta-propeller repeat protein n=1 Tax=Streptomyces durocortorensis TaxID=2811104 RepID=A0ABY9VUB5_9ACTN|nr:PQQ-binding-like beta-propeller repeat protein [Streptomyces durocortorensis]WNF27515.1 PQQ-binding-like beta-propeller repeat protein [Streptomyces durocortorensis]